jgi:hypothetical protein
MQDLLAQARGQLRHEPVEKRVRADLGELVDPSPNRCATSSPSSRSCGSK